MTWARIKHRYPPDWRGISDRIRFGRPGGRCEWCGAEHLKPHPMTGSKVILTVAHLDRATVDHSDANLAALCQRCHLGHDRSRT